MPSWLSVETARSVLSRVSTESDDLVDAVDHVLHIRLVEPSQGDATRLQQVDVMLLDEPLALRGLQTGERKHADLVRDVIPSARCLLLLQPGSQQPSHLEDAL